MAEESFLLSWFLLGEITVEVANKSKIALCLALSICLFCSCTTNKLDIFGYLPLQTMASTGNSFSTSIMFLPIFLMSILSVHNTYQLELTIMHTNDVHARYEEFDKGTVKCDRREDKQPVCYGGVARRATMVKQIRDEVGDNVLFLDGGDQFQGTLWFYVYEGHSASFFMNKLGYDVMVSFFLSFFSFALF